MDSTYIPKIQGMAGITLQGTSSSLLQLRSADHPLYFASRPATTRLWIASAAKQSPNTAHNTRYVGNLLNAWFRRQPTTLRPRITKLVDSAHLPSRLPRCCFFALSNPSSLFLTCINKSKKPCEHAVDMAENEKKGFLSDCVIAFLPSSVLAPKDITQYTEIVESNGALVCEPKRDGSLRIQEVTHIISNTIDFPQFTETQAMMIPVVTIEWVVSSIKRGKQAPVRPFSPDPRMIFSKVTLTCADLPVIDKETIIGATLALGGMESADVTRQTTHICALSLDHAKCQTAIEKKLKVKIVLPHWCASSFASQILAATLCR